MHETKGIAFYFAFHSHFTCIFSSCVDTLPLGTTLPFIKINNLHDWWITFSTKPRRICISVYYFSFIKFNCVSFFHLLSQLIHHLYSFISKFSFARIFFFLNWKVNEFLFSGRFIGSKAKFTN